MDDADDQALAPQTEADRAEGARHAALHQAVVVVGTTGSPEDVLSAARQFYAFLRGEEPQDEIIRSLRAEIAKFDGDSDGHIGGSRKRQT